MDSDGNRRRRQEMTSLLTTSLSSIEPIGPPFLVSSRLALKMSVLSAILTLWKPSFPIIFGVVQPAQKTSRHCELNKARDASQASQRGPLIGPQAVMQLPTRLQTYPSTTSTSRTSKSDFPDNKTPSKDNPAVKIPSFFWPGQLLPLEVWRLLQAYWIAK